MTEIRATVLQDWSANDSGRSRFIMLAFRVGQLARRRSEAIPVIGGLVRGTVSAVYQFTTCWLMGVELPLSVSLGPGCRLLHPAAIVVNPDTVIGARCTLRNSVTIGNVVGRDGAVSAAPVLGDDVEIGAGALIIGPRRIGDGARIGAGAVVVCDVASGATVVGNPAHVVVRR